MKQIQQVVVVIACAAMGCKMETEGVGGGGSSSESSSSDDGSTPTTLDVTGADDSDDDADVSSSGPQDESSSSSDPETSGEESSTGEPVELSHALAFGGTAIASSLVETPMLGSITWTIEMWILAESDEPRGILIDHRKAVDVDIYGWILGIDYDNHTLVGQYIDDGGATIDIEGPSIESGWHHVAMSHTSNELLLFVDGEMTSYVLAPNPLDASMTAQFSVGGRPSLPEPYNLFDVTVDELRISDLVRYENDFDPPVHFDFDVTTEMLFDFEEGEGNYAGATVDQDNYDAVLDVNSAQWVDGRPF